MITVPTPPEGVLITPKILRPIEVMYDKRQAKKRESMEALTKKIERDISAEYEDAKRSGRYVLLLTERTRVDHSDPSSDPSERIYDWEIDSQEFGSDEARFRRSDELLAGYTPPSCTANEGVAFFDYEKLDPGLDASLDGHIRALGLLAAEAAGHELNSEQQEFLVRHLRDVWTRKD